MHPSFRQSPLLPDKHEQSSPGTTSPQAASPPTASPQTASPQPIPNCEEEQNLPSCELFQYDELGEPHLQPQSLMDPEDGDTQPPVLPQPPAELQHPQPGAIEEVESEPAGTEHYYDPIDIVMGEPKNDNSFHLEETEVDNELEMRVTDDIRGDGYETMLPASQIVTYC